MSDHLNALPSGYRLEEYEIVRLLGSGGFGLTYLGFDHNLDKPVAIKEYLPNDMAVRGQDSSVLPKSTADKDDFDWGLDRFLTEARTLARFDNPNLIKVFRFFRAHGTGYIVMEYAEGETLSEYLGRSGIIDEARLKAIMLPLLDGLEEVHKADFLHRDIKPGNIMIREDGSPVLIDFGAARQAVGAKSRSLTAIVTPGYAPIEQYDSKGNQGPWTDIYAMGAVAYKALTGNPPADATGRVRRDPLVPLTKVAESRGSPAFLRALDKALEFDEPDRPQSVAAWRKMLVPTSEGGKAKPKKPSKGPAANSTEGKQDAKAPQMSDAAKRLAEQSLRPKGAGNAGKPTGSGLFGKSAATGGADGFRKPAGSGASATSNFDEQFFGSSGVFGGASTPAARPNKRPLGDPHWSFWLLTSLFMFLVAPASIFLLIQLTTHMDSEPLPKLDALYYGGTWFFCLGGWALIFRSKTAVFFLLAAAAILNITMVTVSDTDMSGIDWFLGFLIFTVPAVYSVFVWREGWLKPLSISYSYDLPQAILIVNVIMLIGSALFVLGMIFGGIVDKTEFPPFNIAMFFAFTFGFAACVSLTIIRAPYAQIYAFLALISWSFALYLRFIPDHFSMSVVLMTVAFIYLAVISQLARVRGWLR